MKKHLLIALSMAFIVFSHSCKKESNSDKLVGRWYFVKMESTPKWPDGSINEEQDQVIEFYEKGENYFEFRENGQLNTPAGNGIYSIDGNKITTDFGQTMTSEFWFDGGYLILKTRTDIVDGFYYDTTEWLEK